MFNSISVICLSVRNRAGDGTETVPTASLFVIIFLLRLEYINDKYGFHTLDRTLRLCIGAWEGEQNSLSSNMLRGIAKLVYVYEDKLRDDLFKEKVGKISPKELSGTVARYGAALIRHGGGNSVFTAAACIGESDCAFAVGAVGRDRSFTVAPLCQVVGESRRRICNHGDRHGLFF